MTLKIYNSLSKKIEEFKSITPGIIRMYNCGPTVYSFQHIGNFRSFIVVDLLRRYLEYQGNKVIQVMNITDVGHLTDDGDTGDDKLEVAAKKESKHPLEIAKFYTDRFIEDWKNLNMEDPEFRPRATETVNEMIDLVKELIKNNHAYIVDGNVYYSIDSFDDYGKLSGNTLDKLTKRRVETDTNKRNPHDFVLWFSNSKFKNHILQWDSPWGQGYPGWHVECSAMSMKFLSDAFSGGHFHSEQFETIDIHSGGEDNRFPHHECEIAQTEGATNKKYVNYWLHVKHLMVEGAKMSKSSGTVYYVFDLIKEGFTPRAIRYLLLSTHYRMSLNFTKDGLRATQTSLDRLDDMLLKLNAISRDFEENEPLDLVMNELRLAVEKELDNDLNISGALGALFEAVRKVNAELQDDQIGQVQAKRIIEEFFALDKIFGILDRSIFEKKELSSKLQNLLDKREKARADKDWAASDALRDKLRSLGIEVLDTKNGQQWKRIS